MYSGEARTALENTITLSGFLPNKVIWNRNLKRTHFENKAEICSISVLFFFLNM